MDVAGAGMTTSPGRTATLCWPYSILYLVAPVTGSHLIKACPVLPVEWPLACNPSITMVVVVVVVVVVAGLVVVVVVVVVAGLVVVVVVGVGVAGRMVVWGRVDAG